MKKRTISLVMALLLVFSLCPLPAAAAGPASYTGYSAIGDSICAGFSQPEYRLDEVGFTMDGNVEKSPTTCYARIVGAAFGIDDLNDADDGSDDLDDTTYNLGKCGCDSTELLRILNDATYEEDETNYYDLYQYYLSKSNLITLEIGSNDLIMSVADAILACVGDESQTGEDEEATSPPKITHKEAMALLEPLLTGQDLKAALASLTSIEPSPEDMQQIQAVLSDDLPTILNDAMGTFASNFPHILEKIAELYPEAQLVILNCYNPYPGDSELSQTLDGYIGAMNQMMAGFAGEAGLVLVDISDTPTNGVDPHPTTAGHAMIAEKIIDALANTITATAEAGGTITPGGQTIVRDGESLTYTIKANKGFDIRDVLVDGVSVGAVDKYMFENVTADHTITASFRCTLHFDTYTALGDSITSGYALQGYDEDFSNPEECYVYVVGDKLTVNNNYNDAMIALTSEDMLNILNNPENPYHELIVGNLSASDLITVDIGSNDLSMTLFDILLECLGIKGVDEHYTVKERGAALDLLLDGTSLQSLLSAMTPEQREAVLNAFQSTDVVSRLTAAFEQFMVNWDQLITVIREINPDAKLAVIGYYNPYPGFDFTLNNTRYGIGALLDSFIVPMNTYISQQSAMVKEYVYVSTYSGVELNSTTHSIGSLAGTSGFDPMQLEIFVDPHPTVKGHAEIAKRILDALGNLNPGDPGYPYHPVYIPYFSIEAKSSAGGRITPSGYAMVIYGNDQTFSFIPDEGYALDTVTVDGSAVAAASSYTFKSVNASHTIAVTFKKVSDVKGIKDVDNPFEDVKDTDWFYDAAMSVYVNDIMSGISDTIFAPDMLMSRGMLVTILYRMEKEPDVAYKALFSDVPSGQWYSKAVIWAADNKLVTGYDSGKFGPDDMLTREQMVTFLYRYAALKGYATGGSADLLAFTDGAAVSDWALAAVKWAVAEGLMAGTDTQHLSPLSNVSRASVAMLIDRFILKYWD